MKEVNAVTMTQSLWTAKVNELLSRLARDPVWGAEAAPLAEHGAALALARAEAGAAGGAAGGRPKGSTSGPRAWYAVLDSELDTRYTQDLISVAEWLGISVGTLRVYLNRKGRTRVGWTTLRYRDDRTVELGLRYLNDTEQLRLNAGQVPTGGAIWEWPATDPKKGGMPLATQGRARRRR